LLKNCVLGVLKLNFDDEIHFLEFLVMFRNLEKERYQNNYHRIKSYYHDNCDLVVLKKNNQQELSLSFGKLAVLCLENDFFSHEKQQVFLKDVEERVKE